MAGVDIVYRDVPEVLAKIVVERRTKIYTATNMQRKIVGVYLETLADVKQVV
jgi:hypothetical protein